MVLEQNVKKTAHKRKIVLKSQILGQKCFGKTVLNCVRLEMERVLTLLYQPLSNWVEKDVLYLFHQRKPVFQILYFFCSARVYHC